MKEWNELRTFAHRLTQQHYLKHIIDTLEGQYVARRNRQQVRSDEPNASTSSTTIDEMLASREDHYIHEDDDYQPLDLERLWYKEEQRQNEQSTAGHSAGGETAEEDRPQKGAMSDEEAAEVMQELQNAFVLQWSFHSVDYDDRERFSMWEKFHRTLVVLYHNLNRLTDNVDYSRLI
jgi:hypothetical protein